MYCRQCGNEIKETDIYCSNCGAKIELENVESGGAITNIIEDKETKFDRFMKKMFFQNKELTNEVLEQAGTINVIGIVLIQFVAFALLLLFDIEIPSGGITLFWWLFDCYVLKKQGIRGKWKIWGFFIIPVYLCIRATKTNKKYIWAVLSILVCVLGIGGAVVSELYGGTEVNQEITQNKGKENNDKQISSAIHIVKNYFETEYVKGLVGYYFEYSDVEITTNSDGSFTGCFDMKKKNKYFNDDSDLYYVEFTADKKDIRFGYTVSKGFSEYMQEAYGAPRLVEYTIVATWNGEYYDNPVGESTETQETYSIWGNGMRCVYFDSNEKEHIVEIEGDDSQIVIRIDNGNKVVMPVHGIAESRIYSYSTKDEKYYLEYDIEKLTIYLSWEGYEGECITLPDEGTDAEYE